MIMDMTIEVFANCILALCMWLLFLPWRSIPCQVLETQKVVYRSAQAMCRCKLDLLQRLPSPGVCY